MTIVSHKHADTTWWAGLSVKPEQKRTVADFKTIADMIGFTCKYWLISQNQENQAILLYFGITFGTMYHLAKFVILTGLLIVASYFSIIAQS